ncbi:MAG: DNA adenine methylase [Phycisphaerales bacterium]|nr:DNA adenine methylase [Phycisphaerales bacterium]
MSTQTNLFGDTIKVYSRPTSGGLLKWIGNKYKMAEEICSYFPDEYGTFYEVFAGSASVIATVSPDRGVGSDTFGPLVEIWQTLQGNPDLLKEWYRVRWDQLTAGDQKEEYEKVKALYNSNPNGADFLFLTRTCYGGVIRFRKADGYMSTPCGPHKPIPPASFNRRVDEWNLRLINCRFLHADYREVMSQAKSGDIIYCDPPYTHSQSILYGAQDFRLEQLFAQIKECKERGVFVALSIDGTKMSGNMICDSTIPTGLFDQEISTQVGRSMLKRFQMNGQSLEGHEVTDRLLLTY